MSRLMSNPITVKELLGVADVLISTVEDQHRLGKYTDVEKSALKSGVLSVLLALGIEVRFGDGETWNYDATKGFTQSSGKTSEDVSGMEVPDAFKKADIKDKLN